VNSTPPLIAVVDDEAAVRTALRRLLQSAGFGVETFAGGGDFLESLKDHAPDCVVLDLHMPAVNGFDVQARLVAAGPHLPVVVITGHDTTDNRDRARALGVAAYLHKPVNDQTLLEAIGTAMLWSPVANATELP
jgi:FixJ family two-component response regulator